MLNIPTNEGRITDEQVFAAFDPELPQLAAMRTALAAGDINTAKSELVGYFHSRNNVQFLFDYRGEPLRPIDPDVSPYAFQSSLGFSGSLREFCLYAGRQMMNNIYVLPGGNRGEVDLGKDFEKMIHFDFINDQGKRHRHHLDMFVRGQFFESLAVLYHEDGDPAVAGHFAAVLQKFFETYPLEVVDTSPNANRFQFTEDRDVMSVGWLTVVFISLLYTELPYAAGVQHTFDIIKHIWFLGLQFRRFDADGYRPYNHHMWERGLVPFILGLLLPELPDFAEMRERGAAVVNRHTKEDFNEHGGYNEHSIAYWSGAAIGEMLFRGVRLARINNVKLLDSDALGRIDRSFDLLALIAPTALRYPSLGDNRGPMIDPILRLGVLMTGNSHCKATLAARCGGTTDVPAPPLDLCDDTAGFCCLRSGLDDSQSYLLMSVKNNCGSSGHNHMDMLSLFVTLHGQAIFDEPYSGKLYHTIRMGSLQRGYMYNMSSHNTVLAYGKPVLPDEMYANKWGVYRPDSPVTAFVSIPEGSFAEARHDAYTICRHRRQVIFARAGALMVRDIIERGTRYSDDHIQRWHLAMDCRCSIINEKTLLIEAGGKRFLCLWQGECELKIESVENILCPDIYSGPEQLAPVIDLHFRGTRDPRVDLAAAEVGMLLLDITDNPDSDTQSMQKAAADLCAVLAAGDAERAIKMLAGIAG